MSTNDLLQMILKRLVRLETRVAKLMEHEGVPIYKRTTNSHKENH